MSKLVSNPRTMGSHWFICETNPCCEDRAAKSLSRNGYGVYAPTRLVEKQHKRNYKWITKSYPIMPGYLLIEMPYGQDHDWWALRRCDGVKSVLGAINGNRELEPFPVPSRLVEQLMASQLNMEFDDTRAATAHRGEAAKSIYQPGVLVSVTKGPFASFLAEVEGVRQNGAVDVLISIFGRLTPMELRPEQVELMAA